MIQVDASGKGKNPLTGWVTGWDAQAYVKA